MKQYKFRLPIVAMLLLLCLSGVAQQRPDATVNQDLALEVERGGGDRLMEIPAFDGATAGAASFRRIKSWKPSDGDVPVAGILFEINREAYIVIAHLSVRLENDKAVLVGTYRLNESDTVRTEELTKFGLEPLVLRVIKAKPRFKDPVPPIMPRVENKTKAIEVVSFSGPTPPSEGFQLTLRNVSDKNIVGLDLFMPSANGNGGDGQRSHGGENARPLISAGVDYVKYIGLSRGGRMTPSGYIPDPVVQQTLIIRTVVFDDGTYDGLVEPAAEMAAERRGQDIQRRRILRLLQDLQKTSNRDAAALLDELKEQAYALGKSVDESVAPELLARFPSLDGEKREWLVQRVEIGLREGKLELLRYINNFEETRKNPGKHITFAEWIEKTRAKYEKLTTTP